MLEIEDKLFSKLKSIVRGLLSLENFALAVQTFFFLFLVYAFFNFLWEILVQQAYLNTIWVALSFQQRVLENLNLGLMDLKLMLTTLCLIFYSKYFFR